MITPAQKDQLKRYFAAEPVDVVYLFGSQIGEKTRGSSDLDIGVLFDKSLSRSERFDLRLKYLGEAGGMAGFPDNCDVVDLEEAPLALRYSVIQPRIYILVRNELRRVLFEAETSLRYNDYVYFIRQNTMVSLASIARM